MSRRLLSVGLSFVNDAPWLAAALESVLLQLSPDAELLLIDDGSSDGSLAIARSFRQRQVTVYSDGRRLGLAARLNQLTGLASGEFMARMDADDLAHPERFKSQLDALCSGERLDIVSAAAFCIDAQGTIVGVRHPPPQLTAADLLVRGGIIHPTVMARRSWMQANPYDPSFVRAEDRELWCRSFGTMRHLALARPLYFYRLHGPASLNKYLASYATERRVILRHGPRLVGKPTSAYLYARSLAKSALLASAALLRPGSLLAPPNLVPPTGPELQDGLSALERLAVPAPWPVGRA